VNQESSLVNTLYLVGMPKQVGHADDLSSELRSALADARVSRRHTHGLVLLPTLKIDSELHTKVDEFLPLGTPVPRQTSRSQTSVGVGLKAEALCKLGDALDRVDSDDVCVSRQQIPSERMLRPPSSRQLHLEDLSVHQLRTLVAALGGDIAVPEVLLEKEELVAAAADSCASAPLPLVDEVLCTLCLPGLESMAAPAASHEDHGHGAFADRVVPLEELTQRELRIIIVKLTGGSRDGSHLNVVDLVTVARAAIALAPLPLLDEACLELRLRAVDGQAGPIMLGGDLVEREFRSKIEWLHPVLFLCARIRHSPPRTPRPVARLGHTDHSSCGGIGRSFSVRRLARHAGRLRRLQVRSGGLAHLSNHDVFDG